MDWDALGAIAETLGAAGVIVTLLYLVGQLRQNTRAIRSSTYEAWNSVGVSVWDFQGRYARELVEIYRQPDWNSLSSEQKLIFRSYVLQVFALMEATYLHHRSDALDDDVFEARVSGFKATFAADKLLRESWAEFRQFGYTPDFKGFLEIELLGQPVDG